MQLEIFLILLSRTDFVPCAGKSWNICIWGLRPCTHNFLHPMKSRTTNFTFQCDIEAPSWYWHVAIPDYLNAVAAISYKRQEAGELVFASIPPPQDLTTFPFLTSCHQARIFQTLIRQPTWRHIYLLHSPKHTISNPTAAKWTLRIPI